ncbi:MAG: sulfite exporter TauE/SafE family protein [Rhodothalassiaceae bacterium]
MALYLPIAEMSINIFLVIGLGGLVGLLSGMFGVGGGFLMTPLLIFTGVPPAVAVATGANLITASSVSGAIGHWRRGGVDIRMGLMLTAGGAVGSLFGALLFLWLRQVGQVDLMISLTYVLFLAAIGAMMLKESIEAMIRARKGSQPRKRRDHSGWQYALPFKMRFRKSRLYVSALLPLGLGAVAGVLATILGVGGGFIMIPAMIYILGMPTNVVIGTSLFQIVFITIIVTLLHAVSTMGVDIVLTLLLLTGAVVGAQFGIRIGRRLKGEQLRALLALIVLGVGVRMAVELVVEPTELYSIASESR